MSLQPVSPFNGTSNLPPQKFRPGLLNPLAGKEFFDIEGFEHPLSVCKVPTHLLEANPPLRFFRPYLF